MNPRSASRLGPLGFGNRELYAALSASAPPMNEILLRVWLPSFLRSTRTATAPPDVTVFKGTSVPGSSAVPPNPPSATGEPKYKSRVLAALVGATIARARSDSAALIAMNRAERAWRIQ